MLDYWKRVAARAFKDSMAFLAAIRESSLRAVFTIIAAGLLFYFHDLGQAKAKVEWWLLLSWDMWSSSLSCTSGGSSERRT